MSRRRGARAAVVTFPRGAVRDARRRAGLAQSDLAARAGMSVSTLSAVENGRRAVSESTAGLLLDALHAQGEAPVPAPAPRGSQSRPGAGPLEEAMDLLSGALDRLSRASGPADLLVERYFEVGVPDRPGLVYDLWRRLERIEADVLWVVAEREMRNARVVGGRLVHGGIVRCGVERLSSALRDEVTDFAFENHGAPMFTERPVPVGARSAQGGDMPFMAPLAAVVEERLALARESVKVEAGGRARGDREFHVLTVRATGRQASLIRGITELLTDVQINRLLSGPTASPEAFELFVETERISPANLNALRRKLSRQYPDASVSPGSLPEAEDGDGAGAAAVAALPY